MCLILGCFFRSEMFPGMCSRMGCAASDPRKSFLCLQCFVGFSRAPAIAAGGRNIQRPLLSTFWKWGSGSRLLVLAVRVRFSRRNGCDAGIFCGSLGFPTQTSAHHTKKGALKKKTNLFIGPRPSSFLCFWVARLDFAKKNGFSKIDRMSLKPQKT